MRNPFRRHESPSPGGELRLIIGLGNPGGRYLGTRHNVGFEVVELLAARAGVRLRRGRFRAAQAQARIDDVPVLLVQPHTYMNRSGLAVRAAVAYHQVPTSRVLVVCDDVHLPLGKLRLRRSGSAGGHNGLASIIECLGTEAFPRLRLGVGAPPPGSDQVSYVLSRFAAEEREVIAAAIACAADAAAAWVMLGIEAAMNRFN